MLDVIQEFYEKHPILFEVIALPLELFVGIATALYIVNLFS